MNDKKDVTEHATAAGWTLPEGFEVRAWMVHDPDMDDPREKGDVYNTDFEEEDYGKPTRGFCRMCGALIRLLDQDGADTLNRLHPPSMEWVLVAEPGDWASAGWKGIMCPEQEGGHELDDPVAVRWWREDRWEFVGVLVEVVDGDGWVWGESSLWSVESGTFPTEIDPETGEITSREIDPLTDPHHPLPDLIGEALAEATRALPKHAENAPIIGAPVEAR